VEKGGKGKRRKAAPALTIPATGLAGLRGKKKKKNVKGKKKKKEREGRRLFCRNRSVEMPRDKKNKEKKTR